MSRLRRPKVEWFATRMAGLFLTDLVNLVNGNLIPAENIQQRTITGTTPGIADTEFTIQHDMGRELAGTGPTGTEQGAEFIYWLDGAGTLYTGNPVSWTQNSFTLKCTDASREYTIIVR